MNSKIKIIFFSGEYYDPSVSFPYESDPTLTKTLIGTFLFESKLIIDDFFYKNSITLSMLNSHYLAFLTLKSSKTKFNKYKILNILKQDMSIKIRILLVIKFHFISNALLHTCE